jgi:hypothetical protein
MRSRGIRAAFATLFDKHTPSFEAMLHVNQRQLGCDVACAALASLKSSLQALGAESTPAQAACVRDLAKSLPSYMTSLDDIKPPDAVPLPPAELMVMHASAWEAATPLSVESAAAFEAVFKRAVVDAYSPLLPALATYVLESLTAGVSELLAARTYGDFNVCAGRLLHLMDFAALDGALASFLELYCLLFCLLCRFHL